MLRITLAQINPTIGDFDHNIALMARAATKAQADNAQLVVFPELSLTAYYPADLLDDEEFRTRMERALSELCETTKNTPDLYWVVGAPTLNNGVGKAHHNSLLVLKDGEIVLQCDKQLLPTYNVFDERRHFEPGADQCRILRIGDTPVGFLICEDGWNDEGKDYLVNPFQRLADAAPAVVVSINASPSHVGKREQRHQVFSKACARHKLPLVYVNQVGGHDQLVYDGSSFAVDARGDVVFEAQRFTQDVTTLDFGPNTSAFYDMDGNTLGCKGTSAGLDRMEFYYQQIVLGVKDYARRCGFKKAVVGCSGGIDSAVTLALAVKAFGAENVVGITMPSRFSSDGSVSDSEVLCANLGIPLITHPIRETVCAFETQFADAFGTMLQGLALENLQARVRGTTLMEYSNSFGHLLLTTGNKSELSVGYCTLYGDTNGGLGLIGDLYKTEVFALCRHINAVEGRELIPLSIIEKEPSAELAPGQKDTDSLPPYPVLDDILKILIEGSRLAPAEHAAALATVDALSQTTEGAALLDRIKKMIGRNEYKRRQSAPILRVRARAFGSGRQLPIAAKHYQ